METKRMGKLEENEMDFIEIPNDEDFVDNVVISKNEIVENKIDRDNQIKLQKFILNENQKDNGDEESSIEEKQERKLELWDVIGRMDKKKKKRKMNEDVIIDKKLLKQAHALSQLRKDRMKETKKHLSDRNMRIKLYEETCKNVNEWNDVVEENQIKEQIVFPLNENELKVKLEPDTLVTSIKKKGMRSNDLTDQIEEILENSSQNIENEKELSEKEKIVLERMTIKEMKERVGQLRRLKSMMAFDAAKFKRLKKIKSRRYHRILRREKSKEEMKMLNVLMEVNPEEFERRMEKEEKKRIMERSSLKHSMSTKWSQKQKLLGKYNDQKRETLKNRIELGKDLRKKQIPIRMEDDMDIEEEDDETKKEIEIDEGEEVEDKEIYDRLQTELSRKNPWLKSSSSKKTDDNSNEMDCLQMDHLENDEMEDNGNDSDQSNAIVNEDVREAFLEDDIIEEFQREKMTIENEEQPKDINMALPGWGSWSNVESKKKMVHKAKKIRRKDAKMTNVIIREKKGGRPVDNHRVNDVPFPFRSVHQFESSIAQPIGKEWQSQRAHNELIKPKVYIEPGKVIEPLPKQNKQETSDRSSLKL
ncbi:hypothetical protein SNEBB_002683 [Seison nebaliae]|nr:hypothetical protein SNEBB_002683 [Seison nebaliae]